MPWIRPRHQPTSRRARLATLAFLDGARIDEDVGAGLEVEVRARGTDGGYVDDVLRGRPGMTLEGREPHERAAIERGRFYALVEAELPDPPRLDALEAALAWLARLAVDGDLVLACDLTNARWWSPDELLALAPDRPFDVDEHVTIGVEAVERRPGVGHIVRSRGLTKFARPDVCARVPRADTRYLTEIVRDVARALALGDAVRPGMEITAPLLPPFTLIPRTDDALADARPDTAPLYEIRDLDAGGQPTADCRKVLAGAKPRPRLKVVR